jgi:hypothetical protein
MKKLLVVMVVVFALAMSAFAADTPKNGVTTQVGGSGSLTETGAQSAVAAEGGNVTTLNLSTDSSTNRWQGYVGNVSGTLRLGRGASTLFDFGAAGASSFSFVFASTGTSFDWENLVAGTAAAIDTAWSYGAGADTADASDSAADGTVSVDGEDAPFFALGNFATGIFHDGAGAAKTDYAFACPVSTAAGFEGTPVDYELMVPADGTTDSYYFYLALA